MSEVPAPKISVIIPTYNRSRFLGTALRSVLDQTYTNFEIVVVDDGSTDDTRSVVATFKADPRVRYIHQENRGGGAANARNTGVRNSRGDLIAFLDDDDVWLPAKLERQLEALAAEPRADVAWCAVYGENLGPNGEAGARWVARYHPARYRELLLGPFVVAPGSTILVRSTCFKEIGLFDESLVFSDMDMVQRLGTAYAFVYVDEALAVYRHHADNMSADADLVLREWRRLLDKIERRIPRDRHDLIPMMLLLRTMGWVKKSARRGQYRKAASSAADCLGIVLRHPLALPRALITFGERTGFFSKGCRERHRLVSFAPPRGRQSCVNRGDRVSP